jgi:hypothetical protein
MMGSLDLHGHIPLEMMLVLRISVLIFLLQVARYQPRHTALFVYWRRLDDSYTIFAEKFEGPRENARLWRATTAGERPTELPSVDIGVVKMATVFNAACWPLRPPAVARTGGGVEDLS